MNARQLISILFCSLWLLPAFAEEPPNVLIVLTDDQGYGDISLHGNPILKTPNLDRFATEGTRFTRFQVSPMCAPTRASLLTGRWALRTGVTSVTANREVMRHEERTVAEHFRSAGYRTACIGKWHNGEQYPHNAQGQGFDEFFGFIGGHLNQYFDPVLLRGEQSETTKGFITDVLTNEAIRFMCSEPNTKPFLCYLAYNAPHTPCQVPDRYFDKFKKCGCDDYLASVYGMCENIDENFGRLTTALEESGRRDNTIVLFLTDNGAHGERFNAGMREGKTSVHEGGTRVPLFFQWPHRFCEARVIDELCAHVDLLPTIAELCDVPLTSGLPLDGISLVRALKGNSEEADRTIFVYGSQSAPAVPFPGGVRTPRWRMVCKHTKATLESADWELYDMQSDPGETRNVAEENPQTVAMLSARYSDWWKQVGHGASERHRIELGHRDYPVVTIHAPQAARWKGWDFGVRLLDNKRGFPGFAADWLTLGEEPRGVTEWDLQIVEAGTYDVEIEYELAPVADGVRCRIAVGNSEAENKLSAFPGEVIPLPLRVEKEQNNFVVRTWRNASIGRLNLPVGPQVVSFRITGTEVPGSFSLKSLRFQKVDSN